MGYYGGTLVVHAHGTAAGDGGALASATTNYDVNLLSSFLAIWQLLKKF